MPRSMDRPDKVAESIAATLGQEGYDVTVEAAAGVLDPSRYDAVVLGSALCYMGRPHPDARRFLKRHHKALSGILWPSSRIDH